MLQRWKEKFILADVQKIFWVAIAILSLLLVISIVLLAVRVGNFVYADKREVSLSSKIHDDQVDIFDLQYKNENGEITVAGLDGAKVLAPGTKVEYSIRIRNTDTVAIDYELGSGLEFTSEYELPIEVRLIAPDGQYILGDEKNWATLGQLSDATHQNTLLRGETAEYTFQWRWPYEGDDDYDTTLGNAQTDVGLKVALSVHSTANTSIAANGGFFQSDWGKMFALVLAVLLLVCSIVLLVMSVVKGKKQEQPAPVVEPIVEVLPEPEPTPEPEPIPEPVPEPKKEHFQGKMAFINLDVLQNHFADGDTVSLRILKRKGLLPESAKQMKVLARNGEHLTKALNIRTQGISSQARRAVIEAGGTVTITNN